MASHSRGGRPVVLAAAVLYLVLPAWKSRRGRGRPVGEGPEDELGRLLSELAARADVKAVRFTVDPAVATTGAVAFGRPGRYVVRLHGGLLARRYADPAGFEAVVLHELAHVRSGDVRLAYATTALWRAFLVGVFLPYVALKASFLFTAFTSGSGSVHWQGAVPFLSRALTLALLLTLARADLLRNRELYADLAAVRWGASKSVWSRYDDARARGRRWMIGDLWRTHPSWERRRRSLNDSTALSGSPALPMLLTGIATLLTTTTLSPVLSDPAMVTVCVLVVAGVVAGIVVMASGLAAARAVAAGRRPPSGVRAAASPDDECRRGRGAGELDRAPLSAGHGSDRGGRGVAGGSGRCADHRVLRRVPVAVEHVVVLLFLESRPDLECTQGRCAVTDRHDHARGGGDGSGLRALEEPVSRRMVDDQGWWGARRMAVASLSAAVFFLAFFFGTWAGPAGELPSTVRTFTAEDFLDQAPPFVESAELRREQRRAWVAGGMDLFEGLVRDFGSADEAMGAQGLGRPERIVMALRTLIAGVKRAERYFPVPDAAEQRVWAELLAGMEREATGALNALNREDQAVFGESMKQLRTSMEQMVGLAQRLATMAPG
ncbi:M48 family metalloprotease [Streptosporangium amethystogenes]|uniref:M48 family metalloprotease n=1 Tax=Streptosporangium amethystogenes TaxID=2002 RepID=UPI0014706C69|nr:M48 family metalloprotease [Streptosporangium amethystogenes]